MSESLIEGFHQATRNTIAATKAEIAEEKKGTLRNIVDRIVRLEEEKKELSGDIKDIYKEAKSHEFNIKAIRALVKEEMETPEARFDREMLETDKDTLRKMLGDFATSPLGQAAVGRG